MQIGITGVLQSWPHAVLVALHLGSYALIGVVIWWNRRLPGLLIIALGGLLNGPSSRSTAARCRLRPGRWPTAGTDMQKNFNNSGVLAHPILSQLGDVVPTPAWLPFRNVISIGDVIALVGVAVLAHAVCDSRPTGCGGAPGTIPPACRGAYRGDLGCRRGVLDL